MYPPVPYLAARGPWLSPRFLPDPAQLPSGIPDGLPFCYVFEFLNLAAFEMRELGVDIKQPFLAYYWLGDDTDAAGFRLNWHHTHEGKRRDLYLKYVPNTNSVGNARLPVVTTDTYLFEQGDSLICSLQNLSANANTVRIHVAVWGLEVEVE